MRPLGFVGNVGLGVCPPENTEVDRSSYRFPMGFLHLGEEALSNVDAMISSWNRAAPNTIPTSAKAGGNYLSCHCRWW